MDNFDNGFSGFMNGMPLFFKLFGGLIFVLVAGTFIFVIVRGLNTWSWNNNAEITRMKCRIVDKRTQVWGGSGDSSASTNYYITFEFEDNNRIELHVKTNQFGLFVVGDIGELTYQGTRFLEFTRIVQEQ